jgi:hypothetical protein
LDEGQVVPTAAQYNEVVAMATSALTRMRALEAEVLARHREAAAERAQQIEEQGTEPDDGQDLGSGR